MGLPYVFILKKFDQTNTDLNEVQIVHGDLRAIQNGINNMQSNLQGDPEHIKQFFTNIIGSYFNYRAGCERNDVELLKRSIQTSDKDKDEVIRNIKDNSLWGLEVCIKGPPDFDTDLYFYQSNVPDSTNTKTYKPYATFGPTKDQHLPPALTKARISLLEYYNSSFHIGSPFWLNYSGQNKIDSIISERNNELTNLIHSLLHTIHNLDKPTLAQQDEDEDKKISGVSSETKNSLREHLERASELLRSKENYSYQEVMNYLYDFADEVNNRESTHQLRSRSKANLLRP